VPFAVPERLAEVDSTNRYLADMARRALAEGTPLREGHAVVAERQSKGRGRFSRRWEAPPGSGVLCSILFRPRLGPDELHLVAWAVALAAVQACRETAGVELRLKWPNDLVTVPSGDHGERKVAGVLAEVLPSVAGEVAEADASEVVVGIGINVNWPAGWPPGAGADPELAAIAANGTALNRLTGRDVDRVDLLARLLNGAGSRNGALSSHAGRSAVASEYRRASSTLGRRVRVDTLDGAVEGVAVDLDDAGGLIVSTEESVRTISSGDVVHLR
jgi:BirA family biotin operon repressor/biotin-[acetyl-CoA-carboxylase] ligase